MSLPHRSVRKFHNGNYYKKNGSLNHDGVRHIHYGTSKTEKSPEAAGRIAGSRAEGVPLDFAEICGSDGLAKT